jgi:hypothetical protein
MSQSSKVLHDFQSINVGSTVTPITLMGNTTTLSSLNSGDLNVLNATGGSIVLLPVASAGYTFPFVVSTLGPHTITAPNSTIFGAINCAIPTAGSLINVTNATGSTMLLTTSGSSIGDRFSLVSDGTNYYVSGTVSKFNAIKFQ